eukprot:scaffold21602_cov52-Phaeocystis_antarctica.AAC.6
MPRGCMAAPQGSVRSCTSSPKAKPTPSRGSLMCCQARPPTDSSTSCLSPLPFSSDRPPHPFSSATRSLTLCLRVCQTPCCTSATTEATRPSTTST